MATGALAARRYPPYGALPVCDELPGHPDKLPPEYPEAARSSGSQGEVSVAALVDESGRVLETRIVHSVLDLDRAAVMAVEQWRFQPAKHFDRAVPVWIVVRFDSRCTDRRDEGMSRRTTTFAMPRRMFPRLNLVEPMTHDRESFGNIRLHAAFIVCTLLSVGTCGAGEVFMTSSMGVVAIRHNRRR